MSEEASPIHTSVIVFDEPLTGMRMIAVSAAWPRQANQATHFSIDYDGVRRCFLPVQPLSPNLVTLGAQLPVEQAVRTLQVWLHFSTQKILIYDQPLPQKPVVEAEATTEAKSRRYSRWLSPWVTLGTALVRGDGFRRAWWFARVNRYRSLSRRAWNKMLRAAAKFRSRSTPDRFFRLSETRKSTLRQQFDQFAIKPVFSIVCPVYNVKPEYLQALIASVQNQIYPYWELCLADDASTDASTLATLRRLPNDDRIKLVFRKENGHIVAATNSAVELATAPWLVFIDNDDLLTPLALFRIAELLQTQPELDLIYSDEAKLDLAGHVYDVLAKPAWSPELLLSYNYLNHLVCCRRELYEQVGGLRPGFQGAQDYDLMLRITEHTIKIGHIPEVLYLWRAVPTSSAAVAEVKPYIHTAAEKALREAIRRRKYEAEVIQPDFALKLKLPAYGLTYLSEREQPKIAAIIYGPPLPTTIQRLKQIEATWPIVIYIVTNTTDLGEELNRVAAGRTEELLLFLRSDLIPQDANVIARLCAYLSIKEVGAVGGLITKADGTIVSGGTVGSDPAEPAFAGLQPKPVSYFFLAESARNVVAPARGVLLTRRADFEALGGFDARRYGRTLFDLEYCYRLATRGLRCVQVGPARFEQANAIPPQADLPSERLLLRAAYGRTKDPYVRSEFEPQRYGSNPTSSHTPGKPAHPLRTLFVAHNLSGFEGAPKVLFQLATGLHSRKIVAAQVYSPTTGEAAEYYESLGLHVSTGGLSHPDRFLSGWWQEPELTRTARELNHLLKRFNPAMLVVNTVAMFPFVLAARAMNLPVLWIIHESYSEKVFRQAFTEAAQHACTQAFHVASRVIFVSRSCAEEYARFSGQQNFHVIRNALDAKALNRLIETTTREEAIAQLGQTNVPDALRIVSVGTICERKAQHLLVEAAAKLRQKYQLFSCYLVGAREGSSYHSYVKHLIAARGLSGQVHLIPEGPVVPLYLRSADLFACTSYVEAYSLSVLEAQVFGLPIISTPCGGLAEQTVWGQNSLMVPFGDADALADQLGFLFEHPSERIRMGKESRAGFQLHATPQEMLDQYEAELLRLIEQ